MRREVRGVAGNRRKGLWERGGGAGEERERKRKNEREREEARRRPHKETLQT